MDMNSRLCTRFEHGWKLRFCWLLAAVIVAAAGWSANADAAARRKSRKKRQLPAAQAAESGKMQVTEVDSAKRARGKRKHADRRFDETVRRHLPDGCRVFGWIDVASILDSRIGQKLLESPDSEEEFRKWFAPVALDVGQVERIVFGAQSVDGDEISEAVAVVFCKEPIAEPDEDLAGNGEQWATERIGEQTIWVRGGEDPSALCPISDRVVLIGHPTPLRAVLRREGLTKLPEELDRARRLLEPTAELAMAILPPDGAVEAISLPLPGTADLAERVEAIILELGFEADLDLRMAAVCSDEAAAQQLNGIATGLLALVHLQDLDEQEPQVRDLIRSVSIDVQGPVLSASMRVPDDLVALTGDDSVGLAQTSPGLLVPFGRASTSASGSCAPAGPLCPATFPPTTSTTPSPAAVPYPAAGSGYGQPAYAAPPSLAPTPYSAAGSTTTSIVPSPVATSTYSQTLPTLPIADVVRLVEAGVDDEVIVRHLRKHSLAAALTAEDLILLTEKGATTQVITTLQDVTVMPKAVQPSAK
jgi:hypothetical protein